MKELRAVLSSTAVDSQQEQFAVEVLESMAQGVSRAYIPIFMHHDPRIPPIGRIAAAEVVPNGAEVRLEGVLEVWEAGDNPDDLRGDGRRFLVDSPPLVPFEVIFDHSHRDPGMLLWVRELAQLASFEAKPKYHAKKAVEPLSTLTIVAGAFVLGGIAAGFLNQLGADLYETLKHKLHQYGDKRRATETLLVFKFIASVQKEHLEVHVVVEDVASDVIDRLFDVGLRQVDTVAEAIRSENPSIVRLVFHWDGEAPHLLYTIDLHGVPFPLRTVEMDDLTRMAPSVSGVTGDDSD